MQPQVQQAEAAQETSATTGTAAADQTQTVTQAGVTTTQAQTSQTTAATTPGLDPNQQTNQNSQAQALVQSAAPTADQWYQQQQQYQQYYQQYPGYDPYQQHYQQYPYQQQAVPQYHQQHLQAHPPQVTSQYQPQSQPQPQPHVQPQLQPQPQPPGQPQLQPHVQAPAVAQLQSQSQVNLQQQPQTAGLPQSQIQSQSHPPQPQLYPQAQPHPTQPHPQQPAPMPQYQQPHQMQHPQPQVMQQAHQHPVAQPQPHSQAHLQAPVQHHSQPHLHLNPTVQPQIQHPSAHAVTGHQSYPQPQPHQQMHLVAPQQHPMHMHPQGGLQPHTQHSSQIPSQFPQQHPAMRPPPSHATIPNQQQAALLPFPGQVQNIGPTQQQPVQQSGQPLHQRPVMQPVQQPMAQQYVQQQPFTPQAPFLQQQIPTPSQLRPQGMPHYPQHTHAYPQLQQNVALSHGSSNVAGRPMLPSHAVQSQPYQQYADGVQARPMHTGASQPSTNQNNVIRSSNQVQGSTEQQSVATSRPTISLRQGDPVFEKGMGDQAAESSSENAAKKVSNDLDAASGLGADAGEVKAVKSETDFKLNGVGDAETESHAQENGDLVKKTVKEEAVESIFEQSNIGKSSELVAEVKSPKHLDNSTLEGRECKDESEHMEKASGKFQNDAGGIQQPSTGVDEASQTLSTTPVLVSCSPSQNVVPKGTGSQGMVVDGNRGIAPPGRVQSGGFVQPSHPGPIADQGPHFGPSTLQQRPGAPLLQMPPPVLPHPTLARGHPSTQIRSQGYGHTPEYFQPSVFKQSQGLETPPGGISGPGSIASFGKGPNYYGFPQQNFEPQLVPQRPYGQGHALPSNAAASRMSQVDSVGGPPFGTLPPGVVDSHGGMMARVPPHGPEGLMGRQRPITPMDRTNYLDGRRPDPHLPVSLGPGAIGQPSGVMRSNGPPGLESSSAGGLRNDRSKPLSDESSNSFIGRHGADRGEFEDDLKQFLRPSRLDAEPVPKFGNYSSRPHEMGPYGLNSDSGFKLDPGAGSAHSRFLPPYDGGERSIGLPESARNHPDFLGPVTGYARHHMDGPTPRSPVREYPGMSSPGFGGLPGQLGLEDYDGRESRRFGDPIGNPFHESRFPILPGHLHRGEFDGPGKLRMGEHLRGGDMIGFDGHLRRGEHLGPRNLPNHLRLGEPIGFGDYPGHARMGNFESFGAGNRPGHPRFGEPGFRSSFSLQGNDGGIATVEFLN